MAFQVVNSTLGRKLATKYHQSTCNVERRIGGVWTTVITDAKIMAVDASDRPSRPDPYDSGTDNIRTWEVSFLHRYDIRMRDRLTAMYLADGESPPVMTVATDIMTDLETSHWVVCNAEDSAVQTEMITFWRIVEGGNDVAKGPYECIVNWEDIAGTDPDRMNAQSHMSQAILTVVRVSEQLPDIAHGDLVSSINGKNGGQVIEVRANVGDRWEIRVRVDSGART